MLEEIKNLIYTISNRDILYDKIKEVILKEEQPRTIDKEELINFLISENKIESESEYEEWDLIDYLSEYVKLKCNSRIVEFDIHEGYAMYEGEIIYENKLYPYTIEERDWDNSFNITFEI